MVVVPAGVSVVINIYTHTFIVFLSPSPNFRLAAVSEENCHATRVSLSGQPRFWRNAMVLSYYGMDCFGQSTKFLALGFVVVLSFVSQSKYDWIDI